MALIILFVIIVISIFFIKQKAAVKEKKWADVYRARLLYYIKSGTGWNFLKIPLQEIIDNPRSIYAVKLFDDLKFLSDYEIGSSYYPLDVDDKPFSFFLFTNETIKKMDAYKRLLTTPAHTRVLVTKIKEIFINEYIEKHSYDFERLLFNWWSIRKYVIERDDYKCVLCGNLVSLALAEVHHIVYRAYGGSDYPDNLVTLCKTCHSSFPQHGLVFGNQSLLYDETCHKINFDNIFNHIHAHNPDLIKKFLFKEIFSENPFISRMGELVIPRKKEDIIKFLKVN